MASEIEGSEDEGTTSDAVMDLGDEDVSAVVLAPTVDEEHEEEEEEEEDYRLRSEVVSLDPNNDTEDIIMSSVSPQGSTQQRSRREPIRGKVCNLLFLRAPCSLCVLQASGRQRKGKAAVREDGVNRSSPSVGNTAGRRMKDSVSENNQVGWYISVERRNSEIKRRPGR